MNAPLFFGNAGDERGTPQDLYDKLNAEFAFDLDAAASPLNKKCDLYFGEGGVAEDALEADWGGMTTFLNPPYSILGAFMAKARTEADKGATVVSLMPVRSDTKYWHQYIWDKDGYTVERRALATSRAHHVVGCDGNWRPGVRVRFLPGRLSFELTVPVTTRKYIHEQYCNALATGSKYDEVEFYKGMTKLTGLPKMAIERILQNMPDDCLLDGAPFPSCVVIFTASA